jgi:hypothetical protein
MMYEWGEKISHFTVTGTVVIFVAFFHVFSVFIFVDITCHIAMIGECNTPKRKYFPTFPHEKYSCDTYVGKHKIYKSLNFASCYKESEKEEIFRYKIVASTATIM